MAEQNLATDMSRRPIRRPTVAEAIAAGEAAAAKPPRRPLYDMVAVLPDGTELAYTGGKYYPIKDDGHPDWDNPVDRSIAEGPGRSMK